jgi:diguanylate cyclase (GGDEF)-like protein
LGRSIAVEDVFDSPYIDAEVAKMYLMRSVLGVPLVANGEKVGGILIGFADRHNFSSQEIALAEQVGGQVALVFILMNSLDIAKIRAEESEKLRKATAALAMSLDVQEVADLIITQLETLVRFDSAIVYLREEEDLRPVAFMNIPPGEAILEMSLPVADSMLTEAQYTGLPVSLLDAQDEPQFRNFGGTHAVHSYLGIPLMVGNHMVGSISLGRLEVRGYTPDEILQARVFANQAGVALQNALLHAREQQLAITDPLTGLYNRRGFFELARHELDRSRRFNRPLAVMMIDIDHFKDVNDQFGHAAGDLVLKELSRCYRETMREADLICRYGGEEFCILLPESDREGARVAAERLLAAIRAKTFTANDHGVKITVSIGVTAGPECNKPLDQLIEEADKALMNAKEEGRDRISYFG